MHYAKYVFNLRYACNIDYEHQEVNNNMKYFIYDKNILFVMMSPKVGQVVFSNFVLGQDYMNLLCGKLFLFSFVFCFVFLLLPSINF